MVCCCATLLEDQPVSTTLRNKGEKHRIMQFWLYLCCMQNSREKLEGTRISHGSDQHCDSLFCWWPIVNNHLCPYILEAEPGSCFTSSVSDRGEVQCEHIPACCPWYTCAQWQAPPLMSHCSSVDWSTLLAAALPSDWRLPAAASGPLQPVCIIQKPM